MRITVAIESTNNPAPSITEPLLTTQDGLIMRGKTELYDKLSVNEHSQDIPFSEPIEPGKIIKSTDHELGKITSGRCISSTISVVGEKLNQSIAFEAK